ncbi:MAG: hypothetical protein H6626_11315 [Pseudobdellovibrionaceae bacterium]|nr:MAG: hypothetical protein H6626_11315 [Pseudobdellovibrionaceae bacterium]
MKTSLIVKLNFLILGLALAVYFISDLKKQGLSSTAITVMGLEEKSPSRSARLRGAVDWCETRVKQVSLPSGLRVVQEGMKWLAYNGEAQELNFVEVEKWFGRFCKVEAEFVTPDTIEAATLMPALGVQYIKGADKTLEKSVDGIFVWGKQVFRSQQMEEAIATLEGLPVKKVSQ